MSTPISIDIPVSLAPDFMGDILVTAFDGQYGGCWYWAGSGSKPWPEIQKDSASWATVYITFDPADCPTPGQTEQYRKDMKNGGVRVGLEEISVGIARILASDDYSDGLKARIREACMESDAGEIDADDADCIVQEALFGKQIYS